MKHFERPLSSFIAILVFATLFQAASAQPALQVFHVTDNPGGKASFVQSDDLGNIYVVEQNPNSTGFLKIYDDFGDPIKTYSFTGIATGFTVCSPTGTADVFFSNGFQGYAWDGATWRQTEPGTLIASGMDAGNRGIGIYPSAGEGLTRVSAYAGEDDPGDLWSVPFVASSAFVSPEGFVLLCGGTGDLNSGTTFVNCYREDGSTLWTRSYQRTLGSNTRIAAFAEDGLFNEYLVLNTFNSLSGENWYVDAIDMSDETQDSFTSPSTPGTATTACNGGVDLLVGGQSPSPFIAAVELPTNNQVPGTVRYNVTQAFDSMTYNGWGPLAMLYDSSSSSVKVIGLSGTDGAVQNTISEPAASQTDEGMVLTGYPGTYYVGATGGLPSDCLLDVFDYGSYMKAFSLPATVVGGADLQGTVTLTGSPADLTFIVFSSNVPGAIPYGSVDEPGSAVSTTSISTNAVDVDTPVTITALQERSNDIKTAKVIVTTATLLSLSSSATTLEPSAAATGTATLNGLAGPSGKVVTLSSNNVAITVPAKVKVLAGQTTANFTISSHPVSATVNVTVTATLGTHTATKVLKVETAPLKSFTVSPTVVVAGATTTGEVIIATEAGASGDSVVLHSNTSFAEVPSSVVIPPTGTYKTFTVTTKGVSSATVVTLTATYNGVSKYTSFTIEPASRSGVSVSPMAMKGGTNSEMTVHLSGVLAFGRASSGFSTPNSAILKWKCPKGFL